MASLHLFEAQSLNCMRVAGYDELRRRREQEDLRKVPIVALSGHTGQEFRAEAYAAGCDAFITKPLDFTLLKATLNPLLPMYSPAA